jgi:glutaredoxin
VFNLKKITVIKLEGDPYCTQMKDILERMKVEFPKADIEVIDKKINPELAASFGQFEYVPCLFIEGKKVYESHPGDSYEDSIEAVRKVFQSAVL